MVVHMCVYLHACVCVFVCVYGKLTSGRLKLRVKDMRDSDSPSLASL